MRSSPRAAPILFAALGLAFASGGASAQAVGAGVAVETYRFASQENTGVEGIVLFTTPFAARARVARAVDVELTGAFAHGTLLRADGVRAELSGLTDTHLRVARTFGRDRVTLALIASLPTGTTRHDAEEAQVADAISADLLPFRISNWGTGGGVGASAAYAVTAGGFGLGVSGGYVVAGEFEPLDAAGGLEYRPGNEATLRVAVDRTIGRSGKAGVQATWQHYDTDELGGSNLYRAGDRLQVVASYQAALGRANAVLYGGLLHRENGTSLDPAAPGTPVQDLWLGGAALRLPFGRAAVTPTVEGRLFRSDDGRGQGWYGGAGMMMELAAGPLTLLPSVKGRMGNLVVAEDLESRFSGLEAALTLRVAAR